MKKISIHDVFENGHHNITDITETWLRGKRKRNLNQHKLQTDRDITLAVLGEECKNKTRRM